MKKFALSAGLALAGLLFAAPLPADTPPAAKKDGGYTVMFRIEVNEKGETEAVNLVKSEDPTPEQLLTKIAFAMARKAHLPARKKDGKPIRYAVEVPWFFPVEGDEGPEANNQPKPVGKTGESHQVNYPRDLAARDVVGGAIVEFVVDTSGNLSGLKCLRASNPEFEKAALEGVGTWKFRPAMKDGKPVETRWRVAIGFETADKIPEYKWLIAPRPNLGSFICFYNNSPLPPATAAPATPAAGQPAATPGQPAATAPASPPAATQPAPAPAPGK